MERGAKIEINLENLAFNLRKIKKKIGSRGLIAVVKADAYGHGATEVARKLDSLGVQHFGVAFLNEAIQLREAGIKKEILVFFDQDISPEIINYRLTPVINSLSYARALSRLAKRHSTRIGCHVNIDTGMGRMGLNGSNLDSQLDRILSLEGLYVKGIMSHFSDADLEDRGFALEQVERFKRIRNSIGKKLKDCFFHMANSAALLCLKDAYFDAVRPGLILYGVNPYSKEEFRPVMTVKSPVLSIRRLKKGTPVSYGRTFITTRDSRVGVIPLGYADGFFRRSSNRVEFLVKGIRVPVIGRVCMDLTLIDLTNVRGVKEGDWVTIVGRQDKEEITAIELAEKTQTIAYEVLTSLGRLNRRVFI